MKHKKLDAWIEFGIFMVFVFVIASMAALLIILILMLPGMG